MYLTHEARNDAVKQRALKVKRLPALAGTLFACHRAPKKSLAPVIELLNYKLLYDRRQEKTACHGAPKKNQKL